MPSKLNPYISFSDDAAEAMAFYQSVFGGELSSMKFSDMPEMQVEPDEAEKVMHSQLETPSGFTLMAADTPKHMERSTGSAITISLSGDDEAELRGYWDKLADGGTVGVPLEKAPWGDSFGMLTDRFGVAWMVNIAGAPQG